MSEREFKDRRKTLKNENRSKFESSYSIPFSIAVRLEKEYISDHRLILYDKILTVYRIANEQFQLMESRFDAIADSDSCDELLYATEALSKAKRLLERASHQIKVLRYPLKEVDRKQKPYTVTEKK